MKLLIIALISIKFALGKNTNSNVKPVHIYVSNHPGNSIKEDTQLFSDKRQTYQTNDVKILDFSIGSDDYDGNYFNYELSDGTKRHETIKLKPSVPGSSELIPSVSGSSEYISKEGYRVENFYSADKYGTKTIVAFGKNVTPYVELRSTPPPKPSCYPGADVSKCPAPDKGIDGATLCSLVGGNSVCI